MLNNYKQSRANRVDTVISRYVNQYTSGSDTIRYVARYGGWLTLIVSPYGDISDDWDDTDTLSGNGWEQIDICPTNNTAFYTDLGELPSYGMNGEVSINLSDYIYTNPTIGELCNI